jgi:hypothetical protein
MQCLRPSAAHGVVEGPPYHCDINAVRALLSEPRWHWPAPPYERLTHSERWAEIAMVLTHRGDIRA